MWELRITHKLITPEETVPNDVQQFETTRELFIQLMVYGVPATAWWSGDNKRHEYFGGRLVWERLAHRVPAEYGEVHGA